MKRMLLIAVLSVLVLVGVASAGTREVTASVSPNPQVVGYNHYYVTVCGLNGNSTAYTLTEPDGNVEYWTLYPGSPGAACTTFGQLAYEVGDFTYRFFDKKGNLLASVTEQVIPSP